MIIKCNKMLRNNRNNNKQNPVYQTQNKILDKIKFLQSNVHNKIYIIKKINQIF